LDKGHFLGGLLKIAVIFFIVFGIGDHVVKTYFPENTLGFTIAFYIVAAWIAIEPLIFDICDISLANKIIRAIYSPEDDLDIAAFYSEEEERSEALRGALRIFAVVAVIIAVVAQIVVLNVGARMREKELDMFWAYEEYYEKDPVEPKRSEEWFEEAYGEEGYVSFKKFGTMCEAYLTSEIEVNGQLTNSSISVFFSYNDGEWEATEVSVTCNEVLSVNTSGTWFGKGRDYHMLNGSEENEITIKLEVLNDTEARGSISCVFRGELGYERGFTAVTSKENGLIIVNAELDSKISSLYHEISFAYDPINETIVNLSNAAGMVLEKIN